MVNPGRREIVCFNPVFYVAKNDDEKIFKKIIKIYDKWKFVNNE